MSSSQKTLIVFTILMITSCEQEKKETPKWEGIRYEQNKLDSINKNEVAKLNSKYNSIQSKDNGLIFTYQIQEFIKDSNQLISVIGNINDIVKKDSLYLLKVYGIFSKKDCLFEISVSSEVFFKIHNQLDPEIPRYKGYFIFKPTSVKSSPLLTIDSEASSYGDIENVESIVTYHFHDGILFLKGNLIDYYLYKRLPVDEHLLLF